MSSLSISNDDSAFKLAQGKVVVITGGASGIGEATVRLFHSRGALVSFLDINAEAGSRLQHKLGSSIDFYYGSVLVWNDQLHLFQETIKKHGHIDIVIANAGVPESIEDVFTDCFGPNGNLLEPKLTVLDINLRGIIFTAKLALSFSRRQNMHGSIVLTGSAASYLPTPGIPMYNVSKHGLLGLLRTLRDILTKEGLVRINLVAPAFTETPFSERSLEVWRREALPINRSVDVARAIAYLSVNEACHGKGLYIAGGTYTELEEKIEETHGAMAG